MYRPNSAAWFTGAFLLIWGVFTVICVIFVDPASHEPGADGAQHRDPQNVPVSERQTSPNLEASRREATRNARTRRVEIEISDTSGPSQYDSNHASENGRPDGRRTSLSPAALSQDQTGDAVLPGEQAYADAQLNDGAGPLGETRPLAATHANGADDAGKPFLGSEAWIQLTGSILPKDCVCDLAANDPNFVLAGTPEAAAVSDAVTNTK